MSDTDISRARAAAKLLVDLRAPGADLPHALPDELRPRTDGEARAIQLETLALIGPVGGWKVGASNAPAEPVASPLPAAGILASPATLASRHCGVEAEISFRFGRALPPRAAPYSTEEVLAAVGSCQAAIEVVEPRFRDKTKLDALTIAADLGIHGALVVGEPVPHWDPDMFATLALDYVVEGAPSRSFRSSNPAGADLTRLLVWLANSEVARAVGGIAEGVVVTTGSWTGLEFLRPGSGATARFAGFPPVAVRFEA